jgi:hypothetical protein
MKTSKELTQLLREYGVKREFMPHVVSIANHAIKNNSDVLTALEQLRKNQPGWFYQ